VLPTTNYICVGTYHKTGTIWLRTVFQSIAKFTDLKFFKRYKDEVRNCKKAIVFDDHSLFPKDFMDEQEVRVLHVIRDPRNMLVSACHYHQRAPETREKWLHVPRKGLGGVSYKEHLVSLPTFDEKLKFEMKNSHRANMNLMCSWDYERKNCVEIKYEDLVDDMEGYLFAKCLRKLGVDDEYLVEYGVKVFLQNHKFVGLMTQGSLKGHIRDEETPWKSEFSKDFARFYCDEYGEVLIKLGYESSDQWVNSIG